MQTLNDETLLINDKWQTDKYNPIMYESRWKWKRQKSHQLVI